MISLDEASARLELLPARLPQAPEILTPILVEGEPRPVEPAAILRPAAVLVLLVPDEDGEALVVLTERTDRGGPHGGEISFPGGAVEPGDAGPAGTAFREAREEIGLDPLAAEVRVLGILGEVVVAVSGYRITPVLAVAHRRPLYRPAPTEVAAVFEAPLAAFVPGAPIEVVERTVGGRRIRYGAYRVGERLVWGATARILGQLGALLGSEASPDPRSSSRRPRRLRSSRT